MAKRLMHMVHLSGNTSRVSKSSSDWLDYTGFPGDVCVALFNVLPGNQVAVAPNPLTKEKSCRVYNCDNRCLSAGVSKVCEIFKVCGIVSLKYTHRSVIVATFSCPKRDAERNKLWLVVWHVGQMASWTGLDQWRLSSIPDLQPSVWKQFSYLIDNWLKMI